MPYEIDPDEMEAAINLSLISPIPITPKRNAADCFNATSLAASHYAAQIPITGRWVSPQDQDRLLLSQFESDKVLITEVQRNEMSRQM